MNKRIISIFSLLCILVSASAVTQQGYVKTIARKDKPGAPVAGTVIRVRGSHNAVESREDGGFTLLLANLQNGEPYSIASVYKSGYEPAEQELIGRKLPCSDKVPVEILLVNSLELVQEKEAIATKARENVEQFYQQRLQLMDDALAAQRLTIQQYEKMRATLEGQYERFEPLIQTMSDLLARTDYGRLDSLTRLVQQAIENGRPEEAERLVREKGRFAEREQEIRRAEEQLSRAQAVVDETQTRINKQHKDLQAHKRDLAEDYYRLYAAFLSRFENDSAGVYIRKRAALDTLNFDYQAQAGQFVKEMMADYPLAKQYIERAYKIAEAQYGEQSGQMATACHELGAIYKLQNAYAEARAWYERSLAIRENIRGKNTPAVAETLNNLGELCRAQKDYKQALKFHSRALNIREKNFGKISLPAAESKNNIAGVYFKQKQYAKAGKLFAEVRAIYNHTTNVPPRQTADNLTNLGGVCYAQKRYVEAQEYFEQAVAIYRQLLGDNHPQTRQAEALLNAAKNKTQ